MSNNYLPTTGLLTTCTMRATISVGVAARALEKHRAVVNRMCADGTIKASRRAGARSHWRIDSRAFLIFVYGEKLKELESKIQNVAAVVETL